MKPRHVVLFGFGKAESPAAIAEVIRRYADLKALVPDIDDFEWGENSSPEGLDHGHSHVFLLTFASAQAREASLVHPDHAAFANWVQPFVSAVTVLDYWVESKAPVVSGDASSSSVP
jgi:Stress responsive A/B Barrel Domain